MKILFFGLLLILSGCVDPVQEQEKFEPALDNEAAEPVVPDEEVPFDSPVENDSPKENEFPSEELNKYETLKEDVLPVLENLGVEFGAWDKETNGAGSFGFAGGFFDDLIFVPFGYRIETDQGAKLSPELLYYLPLETTVFSPVDGVVLDVGIIGWSQDYYVFMQADKDSQWLVGFEHLENLQVKEGDLVKVGDPIGYPSGASESIPDGYGFTELVIWKGGATIHDIVKVCPTSLLREDLKPVFEQKLLQLTQDWEEFSGKNIYNEQNWVAPGCLYKQLTEYETLNPDA